MSDCMPCAYERCDTEFMPRRADQMYCSRTCKDRAHSQRQRQMSSATCGVIGCVRKAKAPQMVAPLCSMHYRRLRRHGDVGAVESLRGGVCTVDGCDRPKYSLQLCNMHYIRLRNEGNPGEVESRRRVGIHPYVDPRNGYRFVADPRKSNGRGLEHRIVMEEHLGRELLLDESVHHRNGQRAQNNIENLELWSKAQPSGQRVADKVAWAVELLKLYQPDVLK